MEVGGALVLCEVYLFGKETDIIGADYGLSQHSELYASSAG